ncbi:aspartic peptidase domain-containing protein [Gigaspora rosea]|uniref:Aspartic peptidase domain-containing protein n=1 Tax=Gigaspora rosea TaxID=44941 RepID=A0A397U9K0_9GLOM|nr:aspartic peptidase domain-containing protein [Gigaspora rosea]
MNIFLFKLHIRQLKRYRNLLIIFTIFLTYNFITRINNNDVVIDNIHRNWRRDTTPTTTFPTPTTTPFTPTTTSSTSTTTPSTTPSTSTTTPSTPTITPITTPLKIYLTFDPSVPNWFFEIDFGTPPQPLNIPISFTSNLLWVVSEFCMSPLGDACNVRTTNLYNTSQSDTASGDYEEFTFSFMGVELIAVWVNDTASIVGDVQIQTFYQLPIGLPKDTNGNGTNASIPDSTVGMIGINPYQNNQIMGIALSTLTDPEGDPDGGTLTFGGVDIDYIIGEDVNNIVYYPFLPFTETDQVVRLPVSNIYFDGIALNYPGTVSFNGDIKNIQFDDYLATNILSALPGGSYSNGSGTIDCNISTALNLSFEFNNQTNYIWRLPAYAIVGEVINGNECSSTITGGANDTSSWVFGSTFIENFYMVFDQANSQLGIAARSDIDYGTNITQVNVMVEIPLLLTQISCLIITEYDQTGQEQSSQVQIKAQVVPNASCISMLSIYEYTPYWERWDVIIETIDPDGYFQLPDPLWAYLGAKHSFAEYEAARIDPNTRDFLGCSEQVLAFNSSLYTDLTTNPWAITFS